MTRVVKSLVFAIVAGAFAVTGNGCDQNHFDMYLGTDAGASFDAPAREVHGDSGGDDADAGDQGTTTDAGVQD